MPSQNVSVRIRWCWCAGFSRRPSNQQINAPLKKPNPRIALGTMKARACGVCNTLSQSIPSVHEQSPVPGVVQPAKSAVNLQLRYSVFTVVIERTTVRKVSSRGRGSVIKRLDYNIAILGWTNINSRNNTQSNFCVRSFSKLSHRQPQRCRTILGSCLHFGMSMTKHHDSTS